MEAVNVLLSPQSPTAEDGAGVAREGLVLVRKLRYLSQEGSVDASIRLKYYRMANAVLKLAGTFWLRY